MLNVLLVVLLVIAVPGLWIELAHATLRGIYTRVFKGGGRISVVDRAFVFVFWPIIVLAYAIGKSFGMFFGKKK